MHLSFFAFELGIAVCNITHTVQSAKHMLSQICCLLGWFPAKVHQLHGASSERSCRKPRFSWEGGRAKPRQNSFFNLTFESITHHDIFWNIHFEAKTHDQSIFLKWPFSNINFQIENFKRTAHFKDLCLYFRFSSAARYPLKNTFYFLTGRMLFCSSNSFISHKFRIHKLTPLTRVVLKHASNSQHACEKQFYVHTITTVQTQAVPWTCLQNPCSCSVCSRKTHMALCP